MVYWREPYTMFHPVKKLSCPCMPLLSTPTLWERMITNLTRHHLIIYFQKTDKRIRAKESWALLEVMKGMKNMRSQVQRDINRSKETSTGPKRHQQEGDMPQHLTLHGHEFKSASHADLTNYLLSQPLNNTIKKCTNVQ